MSLIFEPTLKKYPISLPASKSNHLCFLHLKAHYFSGFPLGGKNGGHYSDQWVTSLPPPSNSSFFLEVRLKRREGRGSRNDQLLATVLGSPTSHRASLGPAGGQSLPPSDLFFPNRRTLKGKPPGTLKCRSVCCKSNL